MELSVASLNGRSLDEWNEAYIRVEAYFLALRVKNKLLLSSLVKKILDGIGERVRTEKDRSVVELASEETDKLIVDWFRNVLDEPAIEPDDRLSARGRLALMLVRYETPWQQLFLSEGSPPQDFMEAMRSAYLHADPDFRFVEMQPRPIDLGIVDVANRTLESIGKKKFSLSALFT